MTIFDCHNISRPQFENLLDAALADYQECLDDLVFDCSIGEYRDRMDAVWADVKARHDMES
jgi:hypothetical protein